MSDAPTPEPGRSLTPRAIGIGLALSVAIAVVTPINDWYLHNTALYNNQNPVIVTAVVLLLTAVLNPLLGARRLVRGELAVIAMLTLVIGGTVSAGLVRHLPAMIAGVDAAAVRAGASAVLEGLIDPECPAALGAALQVGLQRGRGVGQSVLLCYGERLAPLGLWYRQLWAESLGKEGRGTTPIDALGPLDQHSQLQLYLDGPSDKLFTFIEVAQQGILPSLNDSLLGDKLGYLRGKSLGDLLVAECRASADTLAAKNHPVRTIQIDEVSAFTMGQLMMHFMLETMITAHLWGVDAFDQPAVEAIKIRTREVLAE